MNIKGVLQKWHPPILDCSDFHLGGIRLECFTTKEKSVMHFSNISARQAVYL